MAEFYGKRGCSVGCGSKCCHFEKHGYVIGDGKAIELSEIERLKKAVRNNIGMFKPEYRAKVKQIVEKNEFIVKDRFDQTFLTSDTSLPGISACMSIMYYPCRFLAEDKDKKGDKPCMIYPVRFEMCRSYSCKS